MFAGLENERRARVRAMSKPAQERVVTFRRVEEPRSETERLIRRECEQLADFLVSKNRRYGDSALDPVRVFSSAGPAEQLRVRIDDKLSRLARGSLGDEDAVLDLLGYLVLLRVAEGRRGPEDASDGGVGL